MWQRLRNWLVWRVLRHDCKWHSVRVMELEGIVDNLHWELRARKMALAQRLHPFVTWEELQKELQHIQEEGE